MCFDRSQQQNNVINKGGIYTSGRVQTPQVWGQKMIPVGKS
jgi:hypothetical protein